MLASALSSPASVELHSAPSRASALSPREEALSEILINVTSAWGEGGLELPWKCFVCVVTLSMLVPLAVNLALQVMPYI